MKEIEDLERSIKEHFDKLSKKGLIITDIYIEYDTHYSVARDKIKPDSRKVIVKLTTQKERDSVWI